MRNKRAVVGGVYESKDTGNRWKVLKSYTEDGRDMVRVKQIADRDGHKGTFHNEEFVWIADSLPQKRVR